MPYLVNSSFGRSLAESIYNDIASSKANYYQFIGKKDNFDYNTTEVGNANFSAPVDSKASEKEIKNDITLVKRITASDTTLVVPYLTWSNNTLYDKYDDTYSTELQGIDLTSGGLNYGTSATVTIAPPVVGAVAWTSGGTTTAGSYISYSIPDTYITNYYLVVSGTNLGTNSPRHAEGDVTTNALTSPAVLRYVGTRAVAENPTTTNGGIVNNKIVALKLLNKGRGYTSAPALTFSYVGSSSNAATAVGVVTVGGAPNYAKNIKNARFYVLGDTTNYRMYICIDNNNGALSTANPSNYATPQSSLPFTTSDGYVWQYIGTIPSSYRTKFITTNWMPLPTLPTNIVPVPGIIASIQVISGGYGYTSGNVQVNIYGAGSGATASAVVTNGRISKINVTAPGAYYKNVKVEIVSTNGTGYGASARAVIGPDLGFGVQPQRDLSANAIMFATEYSANNTQFAGFSPTESFFQTGIIRNPTKYNSSELFTGSTGTTNWQMIFAGPPFSSLIYVGDKIELRMNYDANKPFKFVSWSVSRDADYDTMLVQDVYDTVPLPNIPYSVYQNGQILNYTISPIEIVRPDIDKYSGELVYTENIRVYLNLGFALNTQYIKTVLTF